MYSYINLVKPIFLKIQELYLFLAEEVLNFQL